jgi:hypothetical protein
MTADHTSSDQPIRDHSHQPSVDQQHAKLEAQTTHLPKHPTAELIDSHVAGHLQAIMALTLRMISLDVKMDVLEDDQSASDGTDNGSSRAGSIQEFTDQEVRIEIDSRLSEDDLADLSDGIDQAYVPDSEEQFNSTNICLDDISFMEDPILTTLINRVGKSSQAFSSEEKSQGDIVNHYHRR